MVKDYTVEQAMKITGLSQPTISIWARRKKQRKYGKKMYKLSPAFISFLKTLKPKNRRKMGKKQEFPGGR